MDEAAKTLRSQITQSVLGLVTVMAIVGTLFCAKSFGAHAAEPNSVAGATETSETDLKIAETKAGVTKYALIAAAVAFGLGAIGAGVAISHVGAAAMGAVAEKPEIAGQALIFVALAEGLVVFGFITALMILAKA